MMDLDNKDKKILYNLDFNSRQPNSKIAKKTNISKQVVGFRINRLIKDCIIHHFHTVIDISRLGFTVHKSFLRLQNVDHEKEKSIIKFLKEHRNTVWVASCDGKYDLAFGVWAKNMEHLDKTLKEIDTNFGEYISERQISTIIKGEYFLRDYLVGRKYNKKESFFGAVPIPIKMDKTNWKILLELGKNARTNAVEIAKKSGISADSVGKRIRKLEESRVIRHYNIAPNEPRYPYIHYKILVGLKNISEKKEKLLIEYCKSNPNIVYIVKSLGSWEFEIDMEVKTPENFREIMMEIKTKFKDIIKDYSALNIYQLHKYNFCPSIQS